MADVMDTPVKRARQGDVLHDAKFLKMEQAGSMSPIKRVRAPQNGQVAFIEKELPVYKTGYDKHIFHSSCRELGDRFVFYSLNARVP